MNTLEQINSEEVTFIALNECILSGQIPDDRVLYFIVSVTGFAEWRASALSRA